MSGTDADFPAVAVDPQDGRTLICVPWGGDGWHAVYVINSAADGDVVHVWAAQRPAKETLAGYMNTRYSTQR